MNIAGKFKLREKQTKEIVSDAWQRFNSKGKDIYYESSIMDFPDNTTDPLLKCYVWLYSNYYKEHKGYVLDVGCGMGNFVMTLENTGNIVWGLDLSIEKIYFCKRLEETYTDKNFSFMQGTVYSMPYYNKWFDTCHSTMMLEMLNDPYRGLYEMTRVSKTITGIIHMDDQQGSPHHTWHMTKERIEHLFDVLVERGFLKSNYRIEYLNEGHSLCAVYIADCVLGKSWCENIEVEKICVIPPMIPEWSNSYSEAITKYGKGIAEDAILPIRVVKGYEPGFNYEVFGDGGHRVNALKKAGIKTVRVDISEE